MRLAISLYAKTVPHKGMKFCRGLGQTYFHLPLKENFHKTGDLSMPHPLPVGAICAITCPAQNVGPKRMKFDMGIFFTYLYLLQVENATLNLKFQNMIISSI
jgi:hypothetical protein